MKTNNEFDYDLFKDEDGKCFIRIKRTGEVTEVSDETFKLLRNEAMAMYRKQKGVPVYGKKNGKSVLMTHITMLSIDMVEDMPAGWLSYDADIEGALHIKSVEEMLEQALTQRQLDIYQCCIQQGITAAEYARNNNVSKPFVSKTLKQIKELAKQFFELG